jgi:cyclophilin family peptidyl-prolyl cis-trans isomerase
MLSVAAALTLTVAGAAAPVAAQDEAPAPPQATPNPVAMEVPSGDGTAVRLTTEEGDVVIGLFNESAPVASENFLNLATSGFYDGVGFHRVVPGFVVQGGDPDGTGSGGPGYTIEDEEVVGEYGRGIVAMARTPQPNSQGSQFFFVLDDSAKGALESARTYAIFGRVIEGMDVVDRIVEARPPSDQIEDPVKILSATVEQVELPPEPTPAPPTASEMAATELAALVPSEVLGYPIEQNVFTAEDIAVAVPDSTSEFEAIATENDADAGLLAVVQAGSATESGFISLAAGSMEGVPAEAIASALTSLLFGVGDEAVLGEEVIADRDVTRIGLSPEAGLGEVAYRVVSGDAVWFVVTTEDDVDGAIAALP